MKRATLAFILALIVTFFATGCNTKNMTKEQAKVILDDLLPKSINVYSVLWNNTMDLKSYDVPPEDGYYEIIDEKYDSIADLKAFVEEAFSPEFAKTEFYAHAFESTDISDPIYVERDGKLFGILGGVGIAIKWNTDEIEIIEQTKERVTLNVGCSYWEEKEIHEIVLVMVQGEWRLASRTV